MSADEENNDSKVWNGLKKKKKKRKVSVLLHPHGKTPFREITGLDVCYFCSENQNCDAGHLKVI